ncbi:uncharacterized protein ZSWIM9-like isoform X2 [Rhinatrema bivittatum]|nr:uncharacterized protein ZSWIM9-like isoform X2 [Rhinatrema bivittatum]
MIRSSSAMDARSMAFITQQEMSLPRCSSGSSSPQSPCSPSPASSSLVGTAAASSPEILVCKVEPEEEEEGVPEAEEATFSPRDHTYTTKDITQTPSQESVGKSEESDCSTEEEEEDDEEEFGAAARDRLVKLSRGSAVSRQSSAPSKSVLLKGQPFASWEEFSTFFDGWCEQRKALFFIQDSLPLDKCKWKMAPPSPEMVEALKYSSVRLVCKETKGGARAVSQGAQKQSKAWKKHTSCRASLTLKMNPEKNRLVVTECQLTHNHPLSHAKFDFFKNSFLLSNPSLPVRITNTVSRQFLELPDVKRLIASCKTWDHRILDVLKALRILLMKDPEAKVKLMFVEGKAIINYVFLQTSLMRSLCQRFPAILFFDRMLCCSEFDLYTLLCVDANNRARECAYCLAQKGMPKLMRFTMASLLQCVPELNFTAQCLTLGAEIMELDAVRQMFPRTRIQICRSQVLEILFSKAQELGAPEDKKVWPFLCELAESKTLKAYNEMVKKMKEVFSDVFMMYFREYWDPRSAMWVEYFAFKSPPTIRVSNFIKDHQERLNWGLTPSSTLAQCILDLVAMQALKGELGGLKEEMVVAARYHSICRPEHACLIEEELGFAQHGTYDIKETTDGFSLSDGVSNFYMDRKLTSCSCSIFNVNLLPCRHLFATRLWTGEALFDMNLLIERKAVVDFV